MSRRVFTLCVPPLLLLAAWLAAAPGEPAPLQPQDLLREASKAPPTVAAILRKLAVPADEVTLTDGTRIMVDLALGKERKIAGTDVASVRYFEKRVLESVDVLLKDADAVEGAWAADKALRATLRFSLSRRQPSASGDNPWTSLQTALSDRLSDVRRRLLQLLSERDQLDEALRWADVRLPLYSPESALGDDVRAVVRAVWIRHAERLLKAGEPVRACAELERIEASFPQNPQVEPLRKDLRGRAESLLQQARDLPDAKAVAQLQQALTLWPWLPGLRDELEKRKGTYQVLYVAVRDRPEYLSPAQAWSDAERQAVELIFEGLMQARHDPKLGTHYRPALVEQLTTGTGVRRPLTLRRDVSWSDGERFTAADVRHTVQLFSQTRHADTLPWRDVLEAPRLAGNPFRLEIVYKQGLLDPWAPLCAKLLPQHVHGKPLTHADDLEFATAPVGTGPYQVHGKESNDGRTYLVLRANPQFIPGTPSPGSLREIRFFAWKAADAAPGQPLPHLVLDVLPGEVAALKKHGYTDLRSLPVPRVWFLGINHRRAPFTDVNVRLALAHAIDRRGLLDRHFRSDLPEHPPHSVNGLFPRGSWANSPVQRVPEELYRAEDARACAARLPRSLRRWSGRSSIPTAIRTWTPPSRNWLTTLARSWPAPM